MSQVTCKNCGYPWATYSACSNCGSKSPSFDSKKNQPKGMGCFIAFIVGLVLVVAIGDSFYTGFMYDTGPTIIIGGIVLGLFILVKSQNSNNKK